MSNVISFNNTITTTGTTQVLDPSGTEYLQFPTMAIRAESTNTAILYIANTPSAGAGVGYPLEAGRSVTIPKSNTGLYITGTSGDKYGVAQGKSPHKKGASAVIVPAAIHFWPMNEGSGSTFVDHIGTLNASTTSVTWSSGTGLGPNPVATFVSASGSFGLLPFNSGIDFDSSSSFTLAAWVRPNGTTSTGAVLSSINVSFAKGATIDGVPGFRFFGPNSGAGNYTYAANTTYLIVATYTVSGSIGTGQLWINGSLQLTGTPAATTPSTASGTAFRIGGWAPGSNFWNGQIAFLRIWNVALTAPQIAALYTAGPV